MPTLHCPKCNRDLPADSAHFRASTLARAQAVGVCASCLRLQDRSYNSSAAGSTRRAKYQKTPKGRRANRRYVRQYTQRYDQSEHGRRVIRARGLRRRKLSTAEYNARLEQQGGVCAICRSPERSTHRGRTRFLAVDHCHNRGRIRGLLCTRCNAGLGLFSDNPAVLRAAIDYLANTE
jgi:hypothetical protein